MAEANRTEPIAHMVESIKNKLKVVTAASIKAEHLDENKVDDLRDIYDLVMSKNHFSISEIEAICDELKHLRKA